jgi:hypothetical protein
MLEGVDRLLRDKTRPSGKPPLATTVIEHIIALARRDPPGEATHWTAAAMAKSVGISVGAANLEGAWLAAASRAPVKLSNDPAFTAKLREIVGLYVDPPAQRRRAVGRREVANSGPRPHSTGQACATVLAS